MSTLDQAIDQLLKQALSAEEAAELTALKETPPKRHDQGDRAIPCFSLAKKLRKGPPQIAQELTQKLQNALMASKTTYPILSEVVALGPYINFKAAIDVLARETILTIHSQKAAYGADSTLKNKTAIVEFSSPNIAKPFSIGHLRSTNLGASLARIMEARGWKVIRINHLGDWGTQFGKMLCAYKMWGTPDLGEDPLKSFLDLYVRFHQEEEKNAALSDQAREWFSRLEKGDKEAKELWQWFKDVTLKEVHRLYQRLNIKFDHLWGESHYIEFLGSIFKLLESKKLMKESQDAQIVDLKDHDLGVAVIKKRDESSLYITRDLAAAIYRKEKLNFDQMIYVVGAPQSLHFQQLFKILELTGHAWFKQCEHVAFGHIGFGDQSMSTRKGNIVFLKDVLDEAQKMALQMIQQKNPDLTDKEAVAEQVGLGAVIFADISARRMKDVHFSWEDILRFEGETGPYLQYSLVRIGSIFAKAGKQAGELSAVDFQKLNSPAEAELIRILSDYPKALEKAEKEREPFILGSYLIDLCKEFNRFYTHTKILDEKEDATTVGARLHLVNTVAEVLKTGMALLGIPTPEKM